MHIPLISKARRSSVGEPQALSSPLDDEAALAMAEALIARGQAEIVFPAPLEAKYERETRAELSRRLCRAVIAATVFYNVFLLCDLADLPDVMGLAIVLHAFVVTPVMLATVFFLRKVPSKFWREFMLVTVHFVMVAEILTDYAVSHSENASHHIYYVVIALVITNGALRLSRRPARWATFGTVVLLGGTLASTHKTPVGLELMQMTMLVASGYASLFTARMREADLRGFYLYRLRDRLRAEAIRVEARRDPLTGLANRRGLDERAGELWAQGDFESSPVSAILFDVDFFKALNDRHGHPAGDACLRRLAACATAQLRGPDDLAARYGGEEFLLLLPRASLSQAVEVAERLRSSILLMNIPNEGAGQLGVVSASFGVASAPVSEMSFSELTAAADEALYAAKRGGRNRVLAAPIRQRAAA